MLNLKEAILKSLDGQKVTISLKADIGQLRLEELDRLVAMGATLQAERRALEKEEWAGKQPPVLAQSPPLPPEGKKPLDVGKVMALKKAGWAQRAIAEEMGVSQATISTSIRKEERNNAGEHEDS